MWEALDNSAARGDAKMGRFKLEAHGPSATGRTVNSPGWLNEFSFHSSPAGLSAFPAPT
jgi:hypothetical protein